MAHTGIYVPTLLELTYKAGHNVAAASVAEAYANSFIAQAESTINVACRKVFAIDTATFTALPATTKQLLTQVATDLAAIYSLNYKPSGENGSLSRVEYEDRINILRDGALRGLSILRDKKNQDFLMTGLESSGGG